MSAALMEGLFVKQMFQETSQLCYRCEALLGSRYPKELVSKEFEEKAAARLKRRPDRKDESREIVTSDLMEVTMSDGCILCSLLLDCLVDDDVRAMREHWQQSKETPHSHPFQIKHDLYVDGDIPPFLGMEYESPKLEFAPRGREVRAMVQLFPESELHEFVNRGPIEDSTSSNSTWDLVSQWIYKCSSGHYNCRSGNSAAPPLPTRIIDIGLNERIEPRLHVSGPDTHNAEYLTLSHCWGSYMPLRLLKNNFSSMQKSIPFSQLSKTFQESMIISKRLGIRYVWIDSLCIIQDSESDWQEQATLMSQFYSNSYLNIAATHAADGRQGCFSSRNPELISPVKVNLDWGPQKGIYYCVKAYFWKMNVFETPLQRRSWVCQERFLPPRTLHFGRTQLFWECGESSLCEQFPDHLPNQVGLRVMSGIMPHIHGAELRRNREMVADSSLDAFNVWDMIVG